MAPVNDAIYHSVHGYPGGAAALAEVLDIPVGTLTHKANPNNSTHYMRPEELMAMQVMSGNAAVLHAMAAQLGYTCYAALPVVKGGGAVHAFMQLQLALGILCVPWPIPWSAWRRVAISGHPPLTCAALTCPPLICMRPSPTWWARCVHASGLSQKRVDDGWAVGSRRHACL